MKSKHGQKLNWLKFIDFWSQFYKENRICKDSEYYNKPIEKRGNYKVEDIYKFIQWKFEAPMGLSKIKSNWETKWKEKVELNIDKINNFSKKKEFNLKELLKSVKIFRSPDAIVGNVLIGHICHPENLPLLDKFVFVALNFFSLKKSQEAEKCISLLRPKDYKDYENYRGFVLDIHKKYNLNLRNIDKTLMAFGQFLNNPQKFLK